MLIVSSKISGDMYRFVPCRVFGAMSTSFDSLKFEKKKVNSKIFFDTKNGEILSVHPDNQT